MNSNCRTTPFRLVDWLVPAGLLLLAGVPVVGGALRLVELSGGPVVVPDGARVLASPVPVVAHIISVTLFSVLGAFQFSRGFRRRFPRWHRSAGRLVAPMGLVAALTGLWMTQFYPPAEHDGPVLYSLRLVVGTAMVLFIGIGLDAIRRRAFAAHGAWMTRAYALGIGAGTQVLTGIPYFLYDGLHSEWGRALTMGAGWAINVLVAEWAVHRRTRISARRSSAPVLVTPN